MSEKTANFNANEIVNTDNARDYALNLNNAPSDVELQWWSCFFGYRLKRWKKELNELAAKSGVSHGDVCKYMGCEEKEPANFYRKLPKRRETYVGIGLAYKQPVETINRWLKKYGAKRQLYIKDVLGDLVWIYLININGKSETAPTEGKNYYEMYEEVLAAVEETYLQIWSADNCECVSTEEIDENFRYISEDDGHRELRHFVEQNIAAFASAYAKPRKLLKEYVSMIIDAKNENVKNGKKLTLNGLRGHLDDSMINYISGDIDNINTLNRAKNKTARIKSIPKNKRSHISMCLALGMTHDAIDEYLEMMGFAPLDAIDANEGMLLNILKRWDEEHPLQRLFKEGLLTKSTDKLMAVNEMLMLRRDIKNIYEEQNRGKPFPYLYE